MTKVSYITLYLYSNLIPETEDKTDPVPNLRCWHCGKLLGRAHGRVLKMTNSRAPGIEEIPVGVPAFECKCPNCNTVMLVVWQ
jgi:phage FluMu protein Com